METWFLWLGANYFCACLMGLWVLGMVGWVGWMVDVCCIGFVDC